MFSLYIGVIYVAVVFMCVSFVYISKYSPTCLCVCVCVYICLCFFMSACVCTPFNRSANSVALAARGFSVVLLPPRPSRQPGGDRVRGGLLGHAVVADHCVETAPRVGVLGSVVGLQRGWDTPLVLGGRKEGEQRGSEHLSINSLLGATCSYIKAGQNKIR